MRFLIGLSLLLCCSTQGSAQYYLQVHVNPPNSKLQESLNQFHGSVPDSLTLTKRITEIKIFLFQNSYLLSTAELSTADTIATLHINPGTPLYRKKIELLFPEGIVPPITSKIMNHSGKVDSAQFRFQVLQYLKYFEDHGYPFASIQPKEFKVENDSLVLSLLVNPGPLITIDSVVIKGFDAFSKNVLTYDFKYKKGMLYSESYIKNLPSMANQIEYLSMSRPPAMAFGKGKSTLYLYFEEEKSNQIDGVIGLNTEENGTVVFTGDIQLRLLHVLKKGEDISIRWRRPDKSVQSLNLDVEIPYLFKSPFWLESNFSLFRQDSTFVNTQVQGLLKYLIESGSFISGGVNYKSSNILLQGENFSPAFQSYESLLYKLGIEFRRTNRLIVPTKGFFIKAYGLTGKRTATDADLEQNGWQIEASQWIPIYKRHLVKLKIQSEALLGGAMFTNETYRIGGLKTLRGFNEQSIYTSSYGIGTVEYRYMIGNFDYLTVFADVAYVENNTIDNFSSNLLTGIGAGINFQTAGGILSFFYALGKDSQTPFDVRGSKIHFGYTNRF